MKNNKGLVKPSTSGNPNPNATLEKIDQVLVNLLWTFNITETYVDKDDAWAGILAVGAFTIFSKKISFKGYSPAQLVIGLI